MKVGPPLHGGQGRPHAGSMGAPRNGILAQRRVGRQERCVRKGRLVFDSPHGGPPDSHRPCGEGRNRVYIRAEAAR